MIEFLDKNRPGYAVLSDRNEIIANYCPKERNETRCRSLR